MERASSKTGDPTGPAAAVALDTSFEPLVGVVRGETVESVHRGALAAVDVDGLLLGAIGDPSGSILLRSCAKPFQAAALIESGAAEAFALGDEQIAVITASHAGTEEHVRVVAGLLERAGVDPSALACGPVEHMCSGKHAGMLLLARHLGVSPDGYERKEHPVQRQIEAYLTGLLKTSPRRPRGRAVRALFAGTDGCGVPVVRTSLDDAAWLYAALAAGATPALARVRDAMRAHPELVAGDTLFDTRLMRAASGRLVGKGGAEGVQGLAMLPAGSHSAVGLVLKIEDGSSRPIPSLVMLCLRALGLAEVAVALEQEYRSVLLDSRGAEVGTLEVLAEESAVGRRRAARAGTQDGAPASASRDGAGRSAGARADAPQDGVTHDGAVQDRPSELPSESRFGGLRFLARRDEHLTICRGDEREVLRFLRDEWPAVDKEVFGRAVDWSAQPYCLTYRQQKKILGVLRGHFIGGLASVDELMVAAGSRGSGIGSLMLGKFEDEARRRNCSRIVLRSVKGSPAEDFYRGRGYHRECVQYGYEFGYDYVRLTRDAEEAPGEAGATSGEGKGV